MKRMLMCVFVILPHQSASTLVAEHRLSELAGKYADDYSGGYESVWPALESALRDPQVGDVDLLLKLSDAFASIAERQWREGGWQVGMPYGEAQRAAEQCLHVRWMLAPDAAEEWLDELVARYETRPILAGVAMGVLARIPRPREQERLASIVSKMHSLYESDKSVDDVVVAAQKGCADHASTCDLVDQVDRISGFDEKVARLMEASSEGRDWLDAQTASVVSKRTGREGAPFRAGYESCRGYVYWARGELKRISREQSTRFGELLLSLKRTPKISTDAGGQALDLDALFTERTTAVVLERWVVPEAKAAYEQAKARLDAEKKRRP